MKTMNTQSQDANVIIVEAEVHIATKSCTGKKTPAQTPTMVVKSMNSNNDSTKPTDNTKEDAAAGLLMLQDLANMDEPNQELTDIPLVPIGDCSGHDNTEPADLEKPDTTIIYDPSKFETLDENTQVHPPLHKGVLTITEIGIGNIHSTSSEPIGPINSEGKLLCDYCKRCFNTRSEKAQHVNR